LTSVILLPDPLIPSVTTNDPLISAEPVNGNPAPPPAFSAYDAVCVNDDDIEVCAKDAEIEVSENDADVDICAKDAEIEVSAKDELTDESEKDALIEVSANDEDVSNVIS